MATTRATPVGRVRAFGRSERIVGVDIARGLAVLGMFGAHVGVIGDFDWPDPETWKGLVSGRSAILFALLAGVSLAIISGGRRPVDGMDLLRARVCIMVRALVLFVIGAGLDLLGTNVAVILTYYAVYFLLALPVLRWPPWALFGLAGLVAVGMPFAVYAALESYDPAGPNLLLDLLLTGYYPAGLWIAFVLVGLGVGRLDLHSTAVRLGMLGVGIALALTGYGLGALAAESPQLHGIAAALATTQPHSGSPFEAIGSTGFALAVLALCLLAPSGVRWALFPVAAVGSMALSAYTAQVLAIAALGIPVPGYTDDSAWAWFAIAALVACSLWFVLLGRGPLERALTWLSYRVAATVGPQNPQQPQP